MTELEAESAVVEAMSDIMIIEANVANLIEKLTPWARHMAARYDAPVYLCGSSLHSPTPRDCDIRIIVPDYYFAKRYGVAVEQIDELPEHHPLRKERGLTGALCVKWDDGPSQAWVDDIAKFNTAWSRTLERVMDIQVWPESHWRTPYPRPVELAAPRPRLHVYTKYCPDPSLRSSNE